MLRLHYGAIYGELLKIDLKNVANFVKISECLKSE